MKTLLAISLSLLMGVSPTIARDFFVIAGQSNAVGQGNNYQSYSGADKLFDASFNVVALADPTHPAGAGSVWPIVATAVDLRAAPDLIFANVAVSATSITQWQRGSANYTELTNRAIRGVNAGETLKGVLWWQGETDAVNNMSQADYLTKLQTLGDDWFAATGTPLMAAKLQTCSSLTSQQQSNINSAIEAAWGTHHVVQGPDLSSITTDDGFHLLTDAKLAAAGNLWAEAVKAYWYPQSPTSITQSYRFTGRITISGKAAVQ